MNETKPKRSKLFSFQYLFYDFVKITAGLPGILVFRPKIRYESKKAKKRIRGGALLISNHVGFQDPIYLMYAVWYRRQRFVCHAEFFDSKAGWFFKHFLCIPIDREKAGMGALFEITDHLQAGRVVTIFPEGQVNQGGTGEVSSFKSGMVLMAMRSGCPIVPIYIRRPAHWYNRIAAVIGEPVDIGALCGSRPSFAQVQELTVMLQNKENELRSYL